MFSILLVDQDREMMALPRNTPCASEMNSRRASVPPRGPEEAGRTSACSPKGERGFLQIARGSVQSQRAGIAL